MKLKNIFALSLFAATFAACASIDEDERFIGPLETPDDDTTSVDTTIIIKKNILIEDFTGQRCINCPNASKTIHQLQEVYGNDRIIAVALHGGLMSLPAPAGLATTESQEYNTKWNVDSWPKGMINRQGGLQEYTSWSAKVMEDLKKKSTVDMKMENNSYNAESRTLSVNVDLTATESTNGSLQVWLIESGIIGYQIMPDGTNNMTYEHNHVFRTSVNGTWGEEVALVKDEKLTKQYVYTIEEAAWKPENMAVVAFVANETGVLQVIETPIVK